jgi:NTE family protein
MIHAEAEVQDMSASSKLNAEWEYLQLLFERGRSWADLWLSQNFDRIGVESTLDITDFRVDRSLLDGDPEALDEVAQAKA